MSIIKVDDVAYPTLQIPDLDLQEKFLIDFGLHKLERTDDKLYMCGEGTQQYIHVSQKGDAKFFAVAFKAATRDDLEKLSKTDGFSDVEKIDASYAQVHSTTEEWGEVKTFSEGFGKQYQVALINAIKELSTKNDALEARIAALEAA